MAANLIASSGFGLERTITDRLPTVVFTVGAEVGVNAIPFSALSAESSPR